MKRLHYFNLVGVVALAVLCIVQWCHDRRLQLSVKELEKGRVEQFAKLREKDQNIRELGADLAQFKTQFSKSQADFSAAMEELQSIKRQTNQLTMERTQLKNSITNWASAVAGRDERLKQANSDIARLAESLNASVSKYNGLATNYNAVVKDLDELRTQITKNPQEPPGQSTKPNPEK